MWRRRRMKGGKGSSISAFDQMAAPEFILKKVERIGKTKISFESEYSSFESFKQ